MSTSRSLNVAVVGATGMVGQVMLRVLAQRKFPVGRLKALAVTTAKRAKAMPELPSIAETLPGFDVTSWEGMLAPAGTPAEVVAKIADEIRRIARDPQFVENMLKLGAIAASSTPQEFSAFINNDYAKWQRVVKEAGITVE